MFLRVETVTDADALSALIPEWEALGDVLFPRVPFTSPAWCLRWWDVFRRDTLYARDMLNCFAVRDVDGRLICVAPMFVSHRPGWGAARSRELQFFGADPNITELRGPICKPELAADVVAALVSHIKLERCCDWVQWRGLRVTAGQPQWPSEIVVDEAMQTINYVLALPETWTALRSELPRNIKESLRKCYNSLQRDAHRFELRVVELPADVPVALGTFYALHRSRSKHTGTRFHEDVFETEASRLFLEKFCGDMAQRKRLRIFQLVIQGNVVATRIGFALGDELYLYYSGYDVEWARYSVMTTLVAEAIQWSIANGFKFVNLSTGNDVSKTRWRPIPIIYEGGKTLAPALRSRAAFYAVEQLRRSLPR
jgi:CelD/BcsL family acetyltransferase involved in cellulose biosynthesis